MSNLNDKIIAVFGGRDYSDEYLVHSALDKSHKVSPITLLVHGDCPSGADKFADNWAKKNKIPVRTFPANWDEYGRAAGPIRNSEMANSGIHGAIGFKGGAGTASMANECRKAKVPLWWPDTNKTEYP